MGSSRIFLLLVSKSTQTTLTLLKSCILSVVKEVMKSHAYSQHFGPPLFLHHSLGSNE